MSSDSSWSCPSLSDQIHPLIIRRNDTECLGSLKGLYQFPPMLLRINILMCHLISHAEHVNDELLRQLLFKCSLDNCVLRLDKLLPNTLEKF
jgi:hypothetical protein